jgi:hypothetical protein
MSTTSWSAHGCANANNASSMWVALGSPSHEAMIIFCTSYVWCCMGRFALRPWIPGSHCVSFPCLYFSLGVCLSSGILRFSHFRWLLDTLHYLSTHDSNLAGVFASKVRRSHYTLYFTWTPDERGSYQRLHHLSCPWVMISDLYDLIL